MNSTFLLNIILLIGANLLVKPFYIFGIDRTVQNTVGTEAYGLFFVFFNMAFLFQIVNDFGLQNYNARSVARDHSSAKQLFPHILIAKLSFGLLFLLLVGIFAYYSGYEAYLYPMISFIALNHILSSFNLYLRSNVQGLGYYKTDSLFSVLDKLFMIIMCSYLLWVYVGYDKFEIMWFIYAQSIAFILTGLIIFSFVITKVSVFKTKLSFSFLKRVMKESAPYALVVFLMTMYTRIDAYMIEQLLLDGKEQAGIYAAGYRILDAANMIGFLFAGLLLPMFSGLIADKNQKGLNKLVDTGLRTLWYGAIPIAVLCFLYKYQIVDLMYIDANSYWGDVFGWLILSFLAMTGTYIFGTILTASGKLYKLNIIFVISILLNIFLNFIVIPSHKAEGAAISTLLTQAFAFIAQMYLAIRLLQLRINLRSLGRLFIYTILTLSISLGILYIYPKANMILFSGCFLMSLILGLLVNVVDYQTIIELIRAKIK